MLLLTLFWELFRLSLFVVGGGYAIIVVADEVFAKRGWTREGELIDRLPVFQMIPGLIATHTAVYVGRKVAGRAGAAVGVAAVALPSVVIFTLVSAGYRALPLDDPHLVAAFTGLRAALTGIIAATVVRGWRRSLPDAFAYSLLAAALAALWLGVAVPWVLTGAMAAGLAAVPRDIPDGEARRSRVFRSSWLPLLVFLKYGALCFGGGFVLVPMYMEDFVGASAPFLQLPEHVFGDLMALTQMTPGPIGVNAATFFGYRLAGAAGAVLASAALLLPGSLLAYFAFASLDRFSGSRIVRGVMKGVRPASVALMLAALAAFARLSVLKTAADGGSSADPVAIAVMAAAVFVSIRRLAGPVTVIWASAAVSVALQLLSARF